MSSPAGAAGRLAPPQGRSGARWARRVRYYLPAVLVFAGGILGWEFVVGALGLQGFVLPKPSAIVTALVENLNSPRFGLLPSARATLVEALGGLAIGTMAGLVVALATARWATARERWVAGSASGRAGAEDARPVRPGVGSGSHGTRT